MTTNHLKAKTVSRKSVENRLLLVLDGFLELAELSLRDLQYTGWWRSGECTASQHHMM